MMMAGLLFFLWRAIFQNSVDLNMPFNHLITYVCLGQVISLTRISWVQRNILYRAVSRIRTGDIVIDFVRPVDYQAFRLTDAVGLFIAEIALINLPAYLLSILLLGIDPPASLEAAIGFSISLIGAFLIAFSMNYLMNMMTFWTMETLGLMHAQKAIIDILAGSLIPLSLLPDFLRIIALYLPFQAMAYVPLSIYIGAIAGADIWIEILKQGGWVVGMLLLTRWLWVKVSKKIVIQGG